MTLKEQIERHEPYKMPPVGLYIKLLCAAERKFHIHREEARERYGLYTNQQWLELLNF